MSETTDEKEKLRNAVRAARENAVDQGGCLDYSPGKCSLCNKETGVHSFMIEGEGRKQEICKDCCDKLLEPKKRKCRTWKEIRNEIRFAPGPHLEETRVEKLVRLLGLELSSRAIDFLEKVDSVARQKKKGDDK